MHKLYLAPTSLPDTPPLAFLDAAAQAGFDGVGVRLVRSPGLAFHPVLGDAQRVDDLRHAVRDTQLEVLDILSFYLTPEPDFDRFEPALALGAELGARYALTMGDDPDWPRLVDHFAQFAELAARYRLVPALEAAVTRPIATLDQTLRLIEATAPRRAVICLDPLNFIRAGDAIPAIAAAPRELFPYAQLTDGVFVPGPPDAAKLGTPAMPPNERRLPGEGMLPLADFLACFPADVPLSLEVPPPAGDRSAAADWARRIAAASRRVLAQPGARSRPAA